MTSDLSSLRIEKSLKSQPSGRRRKWLWVVLVLVALGIGYGVMQRGRAGVPEVSVQKVQEVSPDEQSIILNATGYIIAAHKIELAPKIVGRVSWVGVERADKVEKDQVLVRLEDDEYKARALQAQGQLDAAKARLAELQNGSRPEEIQKAKAEVDAAIAELDSAAARVKRQQLAAEARAVSAQDVEEAVYRQKAQEARVASLRQAYELMRQGPRKEQIDAQKAVVEQLTGVVQLAQIDLANTVIRAPISGTILERNVEVGEYVTTGFVGDKGAKGYVVSLADLGDLRVELDISQDDFAKIGKEQTCIVTTDAYPDRKYEGVVDLIAPEANRQKATVQVRVKILKPDELLRPDMNASVAFRSKEPVKEATAAIVVPAAAVRDGAVFVVSGDIVQRRAVQTGVSTSKGVTVTSGLAAGEEVVANPPEKLADGERVRRQEKQP